MIERECCFSLEECCSFCKLGGLAIGQLRRSLKLMTTLKKLTNIENDSLEVVSWLLEVTISLQETCLIVEDGRY